MTKSMESADSKLNRRLACDPVLAEILVVEFQLGPRSSTG